MERNNSSIVINTLIVLIGALLFVPFLGNVHLFDWDEINFAESAREMIVTGDYLTVQVDFKPFWEKPPLFIWMQVLSMKLFGINEFAARFPNAICGIVTLLILFNIGKRFEGKEFGLIWVLVYIGSLLPFFYFKSGIIDPWFNLFIFLGIYYLYNYFEFKVNKKLNIILAAFFVGLAVLTKGPVGFLIFGLSGFIYWAWKRFKLQLKIIDVFIFILIFSLIGGLWFILQIFNGNYSIIREFIVYQIRLFNTQDAGHGGFLLYHFVVLLVGVFPASIFAIKSFKKNVFEKTSQQNFKLFMAILFWTVLLLFTIVKTKIVHYSSMCYFPMTFLAASVIYNILQGKDNFNRWVIISISALSILFAMLVSAFPIIEKNKERIIDSGIIKDKFAAGNLMADAGWTGYEFLIGVVLLISVGMAIFYRRKSKIKASIASIFIGSLLFISLTILFIPSRIEKYSQNALIEFIENNKDKDCYITALRMHSYAHYFYGEKEKPVNMKSYDKDWLLSGDIDKDVYFIMRNNRADRYLDRYKELELFYEKNGYSFLLRRK